MNGFNKSSYRSVPVEEWSKLLNIKWSFDLKNPIYNPYTEEKWYADGTRLIAGWVSLNEFFSAIPKNQQWKGDEIWKNRLEDRINGVIDFWKKGGCMTPPLIDTLYNFIRDARLPIEDPIEDSIIIRAGNHRFSVCCLIGLDKIPFFTPDQSKKSIEEKLKSVCWI